MSDKKLSTGLVHTAYTPPANFGSLTTPIHHASTVTFPNVAAMRARDWRRDDQYSYGLTATPTTYTLQNRIAEIEGGRHTLLTPSGLSAIALVDLALLRAGDEVLLPDNVYNPSRELGDSMLRDFGISARYYDPLAGLHVADMIAPNTRLMWIEAPGSVSMEIPDIPALVKVAKAHAVITAIDNTWSAGVMLRPFDLGIDISMQALTKYQSGGSDVLMGAVTTVEASLHEELKQTHNRLGLGVGPDDAYLMLRSLPTLEVRLRRHEESAMVLARWLKERPEVNLLLHPASPDCPGHEFWERDFHGAGGLFSVTFQPDITQAKIDAMVDALQLFQIGFSWGGAASLAVPYTMKGARSAVPWEAGGLVRFYVGLEHPADLIADLEQAFTLAFA
jgi:cystathionine beta-lyase